MHDSTAEGAAGESMHSELETCVLMHVPYLAWQLGVSQRLNL